MIKNFTSDDVPDQSGKTILVTGANTGIGFETAMTFAKKGARVILGCRNLEKGKNAVARITQACPGADLELVCLDLMDLHSVHQAAEQILKESRLDVLVNNAGIMGVDKTLTKDGFEPHFGVNHLAHFVLTALLLPLLESTADSRIVTISSVGHKQGDRDLDWDDINAEASYIPMQRYFASKLANLLFTYELDRRLRAKGSTTISVAAHPGGAITELTSHTVGFFGWLFRAIQFFGRPFMNSAEQGAWPTELAATAPGVEGGQYFGPSKYNETSGTACQVDSIPESKDPERAQRLWNLSIKMTGVDPGL